MKNLRDFLILDVVKNGMKSNFSEFDNDEKIYFVINDILKINSNNISKKLSGFDDKNLQFESCLYYGENTNKYLLELRLFDNLTDNMTGAYLEVFNNDLTELKEDLDDVWSYDNWNIV